MPSRDALPRKVSAKTSSRSSTCCNKETLCKAEREQVKQASQSLLTSLRELLSPMERWTEKEQTQAEVEILILDRLYTELPSPPFTNEDKQAMAAVVYRHVRQQSVSGALGMAA